MLSFLRKKFGIKSKKYSLERARENLENEVMSYGAFRNIEPDLELEPVVVEAPPSSHEVPEQSNRELSVTQPARSLWQRFLKKKPTPATQNLQGVDNIPSLVDSIPPPPPSVEKGPVCLTSIFLTDPDKGIKEVPDSKLPRDTKKIEGRMNKQELFLRFKIGDKLGGGAFGSVFKVKGRKDKKILALKVIQGAREVLWNTENEINCIKLTSGHPLFLKFHTSYSLKQDDGTVEYGILTELFPSKNLYEMRFSQAVKKGEAQFILYQLGIAIKYLHSLNIIHADIKAENVLVNQRMKIKVIDMGLCMKGPYTVIKCGTEGYMAPEVTSLPRNVIDRQPYSYEVDYFGAGAVLYDLLYGHPPPASDAFLEMIDKLLRFSEGVEDCGERSSEKGYQDKITKGDIVFIAKLLNDCPAPRPNDATFLSDKYFDDMPRKYRKKVAQ